MVNQKVFNLINYKGMPLLESRWLLKGEHTIVKKLTVLLIWKTVDPMIACWEVLLVT